MTLINQPGAQAPQNREIMKREFFVIVTEHDCDQRDFPHQQHASMGSIVMETYLKDADIVSAIERCEKTGGKFGRTGIAKLVFLTDEEIQKELTR
jgi:HD superfamily phosphohydrolase YqeK